MPGNPAASGFEGSVGFAPAASPSPHPHGNVHVPQHHKPPAPTAPLTQTQTLLTRQAELRGWAKKSVAVMFSPPAAWGAGTQLAQGPDPAWGQPPWHSHEAGERRPPPAACLKCQSQ